jgi:hypothetical protein
MNASALQNSREMLQHVLPIRLFRDRGHRAPSAELTVRCCRVVVRSLQANAPRVVMVC